MLGAAIASSIHFVCRFLIAYFFISRDEKLKKCFISFNHPDSWKDLGHITKVGWNSFLLKVMGWWAFDIFT